MVPPMLENPSGVFSYVPAVPAVLLLLMSSGVHDLAAQDPEKPNERAWAVGALALTVLAALFSAGYAALQVWRPDGSWEALAAPRLPLVLLAGWALSERLDQLARALGAKAGESGLLDDLGSLALLLGIPLVLPQLVPSLPSAQDLLGPLARPLMLFLLAGVALGCVRLGSQLVLVARSGEAREI
jgi:hypothetical protein